MNITPGGNPVCPDCEEVYGPEAHVCPKRLEQWRAQPRLTNQTLGRFAALMAYVADIEDAEKEDDGRSGRP